MDKLKMHSPDLTESNLDKIAELFPQVMTESTDDEGNVARAVDFDLLRQELSNQVVEGPQERYQLDWPGKRAALFAANAPIAKTLRPMREESVDFDTTKNLFIEGDNLDALKLLQESYLGKVKLIYIDPPYNTGSDLLYEDDFASSTADYLADTGQTADGLKLRTNFETNGRFHSNWLSMMYPRLKLARNLLSRDGIIFVSIDDNEGSNLRRLMDEVFGAANLFAEMVVVRAEGGGLAKRVVKGHDYLIGYTREAQSFPGMYRAKDVRGKVVEKDGRQYWIETDWLRAEFGKYGTLRYEDIESVKGQKKKDEIDSGLASGEYCLIPQGQGNIVGRFRRLDEDGSKFYSVMKHLNKDAKNALRPLGMEDLFDNPKPLSLIKELVMGATRFSGGSEQVVLDFFAGSGTTAHAVLEANAEDAGNRRYILVQLDEVPSLNSNAANAGYQTISDLTRARLMKTGEHMLGGSHECDCGFRALRVDSTSMNVVLLSPDETGQADLGLLEGSVKADRTSEDLLFQVLLDWGLELSLPIEQIKAQGQEAFIVDGGALIACFESSVTAETVRAIADLKPLRAVFRDSAFDSDKDRINAEQAFKQISPDTDVKVI